MSWQDNRKAKLWLSIYVFSSGVNFINVKRTNFLYVYDILAAFLVTFWLWQKIRTKNAREKCWWNWPQVVWRQSSLIANNIDIKDILSSHFANILFISEPFHTTYSLTLLLATFGLIWNAKVQPYRNFFKRKKFKTFFCKL